MLFACKLKLVPKLLLVKIAITISIYLCKHSSHVLDHLLPHAVDLLPDLINLRDAILPVLRHLDRSLCCLDQLIDRAVLKVLQNLVHIFTMSDLISYFQIKAWIDGVLGFWGFGVF